MLPEPILLGMLFVALFGALTLALAIGGATAGPQPRPNDELDEVSSTHG